MMSVLAISSTSDSEIEPDGLLFIGVLLGILLGMLLGVLLVLLL